MEKIDFKGEMKIKSSMDLNTYVITNKNGKYIGELIISDSSLQERIEKVLISRGKATGELKLNENFVKGGLKALISLEVSSK